MVINQAYLFLIFTLNGVFIGLLFDFFRILRKSFKTNNFITYVEDILFWVLTGLSIIFSMYNFSDGSLRFFMFIGICLGIAMYILTLSKFIINTFVFIISIFKKLLKMIIQIISTPLKLIYSCIDKLLFRPTYILYIKLTPFLTKRLKIISKKINNMKK